MTLAGLQTHFNARIDLDSLRQIRAFGFRMARMDCQTCSHDVMLAMIEDAQACNLIPLPIVSDVARLSRLPSGIDVEWTNEPDGDISPAEYHRGLDDACEVAIDRGVRLWAPAISNLDQDSLGWLNDVRDEGNGWPVGLHGISAHRYGDGLFEPPHEGFASRAREVVWLEAACAGKPYLISEVGYPTMDGLTEAQQAQRLALELQFFTNAYAVVVFQLNDGPHRTAREHNYGIRRCNAHGVLGEWKPSAHIVTLTQPQPVREYTTFAVVVTNREHVVEGAGVILSEGQASQEGFTNHDGYLPFRVEVGVPFTFSVHKDGYVSFESDVQVIRENTDYHLVLAHRPNVGLFLPESGRLHIEGKTFRTEHGELWQWRGFSWFLGFLRFCHGEDVISDLRWFRQNGFNVVRVFGPLPWKETPDYHIESWTPERFDMLSHFCELLALYGIRMEFVPICYGKIKDNRVPEFTLAQQRDFVQRVYDVVAQHWNVLIEVANEPHVNDTDPVAIMKGINRRGVLSAYGEYAFYYDGSKPKVKLDYATIHPQRDTDWPRKARHAQEMQAKLGVPTIINEPAKAIELNFNYPGGKRNPDEFVWHHAIAAMYTPGSTLHTEEGKWGRVPQLGTLQSAIVNAVREDVWLKIGPEWQGGAYAGAHLSKSPVDGKGLKINGKEIWTYSCLHEDKALSVRCAVSSPQPKVGWRKVAWWGAGGSIVRLER